MFLAFFMCVFVVTQEAMSRNETTMIGLSTYTSGMFLSYTTRTVKDDVDATWDDTFGPFNITTTFFGREARATDVCNARTLGTTNLDVFGCVLDVQVDESTDPMESCTLNWQCNLPLNITGTTILGINNVPMQWQAMKWSTTAVSRSTRDTGRHSTTIAGLVVPRVGTFLCGTSTMATFVKFKLTRGFAVVDLQDSLQGTSKSTTAGIQNSVDSKSKTECNSMSPGPGRDRLTHSFQFKFSVSENILIEKTSSLLGLLARMALALSLTGSGVKFLQIIKIKVQKVVDEVYIYKYPTVQAGLPLDIAGRYLLTSKEDRIKQSASALELKSVGGGGRNERRNGPSIACPNDDMAVAISLPNIRRRKSATVKCQLEMNPMKGGESSQKVGDGLMTAKMMAEMIKTLMTEQQHMKNEISALKKRHLKVESTLKPDSK